MEIPKIGVTKFLIQIKFQIPALIQQSWGVINHARIRK